MRFLPQLLYDRHDIFLLTQKCFSQFSCLVKFVAHGKENIREMTKRFNTWVPGHFLKGIVQCIPRQANVLTQPAFGLNDLERIG